MIEQCIQEHEHLMGHGRACSGKEILVARVEGVKDGIPHGTYAKESKYAPS